MRSTNINGHTEGRVSFGRSNNSFFNYAARRIRLYSGSFLKALFFSRVM